MERVNLILAVKISRDSLHPVSILVDLVPLFAVGVLHFPLCLLNQRKLNNKGRCFVDTILHELIGAPPILLSSPKGLSCVHGSIDTRVDPRVCIVLAGIPYGPPSHGMSASATATQ